jgi:hypothetical protein
MLTLDLVQFFSSYSNNYEIEWEKYDTVTVCYILDRTLMFDIWFGAEAIGARAAFCWGSGFTKMIRLRLSNTGLK